MRYPEEANSYRKKVRLRLPGPRGRGIGQLLFNEHSASVSGGETFLEMNSDNSCLAENALPTGFACSHVPAGTVRRRGLGYPKGPRGRRRMNQRRRSLPSTAKHPARVQSCAV